MTTQTIACQTWTGLLVDQPLSQFLKEHLAEQSPVIVWREPVNARQREKNFVPLTLVSPLSDFGDNVALSEARLHYDNGLLHLLADGSQTRFAGWIEAASDAKRPAWIPDTAKPFWSDQLVRSESPVLLQKNEATHSVQRGLRRADLKGHDQLVAIQYHHQGTLKWWRLLPPTTNV